VLLAIVHEGAEGMGLARPAWADEKDINAGEEACLAR
jgi:hypothetical protein